MTRDHWTQIAVIAGIIATLGAAEWTISTMHERDMAAYSDLAQRTARNETEIIGLKTELGQLLRDQSSFQAEMRSNNTLVVGEFSGLKATLDAIVKDQGRRR